MLFVVNVLIFLKSLGMVGAANFDHFLEHIVSTIIQNILDLRIEIRLSVC